MFTVVAIAWEMESDADLTCYPVASDAVEQARGFNGWLSFS